MRPQLNPLDVLRTFVIERREIKLVDKMLVFGSQQFEINMQVGWKPKIPANSQPYKIGDLWFYLKYCSSSKEFNNREYFTDYGYQGRELGLSMIKPNHQGKKECPKSRGYQEVLLRRNPDF